MVARRNDQSIRAIQRRLRRGFQHIRESIQQAASEAVESIARKAKNEFVSSIKRQTLPDGPPLSPAYLARKKREGRDSRRLISTGFYLKHIVVLPLGKGAWSVEIEKVKAVKAGRHSAALPLATIARALEYGTSMTPARPHWRPMYGRLRRRQRSMRKQITNHVIRQVKRRLGAILKVRAEDL